jgi:uncharacterized protein (DUF2147 family)
MLVACGSADKNEGYVLNENGDIHITESGATLSDLDVSGDLFIDETVGDGGFTLENINISGTLYVNGGGENAGYLTNVSGTNMIVESKDGAQIVCTTTSMDGVQLLADCKIESDGSDIKKVTVGSSKTENAINVSIKGEYHDVTFESTANAKIDGKFSVMTVLEEASMTSIEMADKSECLVYACHGESVTITGGTIIEAWIDAEYCSIPEDTNTVGTNVGIVNVTKGDIQYSIPDWTSASDSEELSDDSAFEQGYPKISRSGSIITVLSSCETACTVYVSVEDQRQSIEGMSADKIIHPENFNNDPDYIPITGSVIVSKENKTYTVTINLANVFGDNMDQSTVPGFAVFVIAEFPDGSFSNINRGVVK